MTAAPGANARLVGQLLAWSGIFMLAVALAAWLRWLPYAEGSVRTLAKVFLFTGCADLIIAVVLMSKHRR